MRASAQEPQPAADPTPFSCDIPTWFLGQLNPTQLYTGTFDAGGATIATLGDLFAPETGTRAYNSMGFDPNSFFMYATQNNSNTLLRIDSTGAVTNLGPVAGLPTALYAVGAFDL
ncbi:MAG: hypothetical protein J2P17_32345, partial [Mycobacterium sp.]|nr:hypothetical protein [Mycobacterium sp.]